MKSLNSFRSRLLLTYIGLIVLGFGGLTWLAGQQLSRGTFEDFTNNLKAETRLLASAIEEPVEEFFEQEISEQGFIRDITQFTNETNSDLSILSLDGKILYSQSGQAQALDTYADGELQLQNDEVLLIESQTPVGDRLYHATTPIVHDREQVALVQVHALSTPIEQTISQRQTSLGIGFVVFALLGLTTSLWLSSTLTRPLAQLRAAALNIAGGNLDHRVTTPGPAEIGAVGEAFNQMATQVEAMIAEQRAFSSNVSHELRTPLTTIRLRTEQLISGDLPPEEAQQYIAEVDSEALRLSGLVDDLILLSRLDADRLDRGREHVDLTRIGNSLLRELQPLAESKSIRLTLSSTDGIPPIEANMNHLRVVFRNLLENSIKYTPSHGEVTWTIEADGHFVKATVKDNGQGIAPDELAEVTKRFFRADKARSRRIEGIGLGLALVKSIIDLYGGRLDIASDGVGRGTTVTVWWPTTPMN